jgi:hypothetical protein
VSIRLQCRSFVLLLAKRCFDLLRFRDSFRELSENFKANALEANANIFKEVQAFQEAVHAAQAAAVAKSIEFITAFQKLKKTVCTLHR